MNDVALKRMAIAFHGRDRCFLPAMGNQQFALFGSVLREDFGPESDVDVLLTFRPDAGPAPDRADAGSEALFRRPVDVTYRRVIGATQLHHTPVSQSHR